MIKFALIAIAALILVAGVFLYQDQNQSATTLKVPSASKELPAPQTQLREDASAAPTKTVQPQEQKAKTTTTSSVSSPKLITPKMSDANKAENIYEIGKNITQEDIDNAATEEERQRLIDDRAFAQSLQKSDVPRLSGEEILKIIEEDLKKENKQ